MKNISPKVKSLSGIIVSFFMLLPATFELRYFYHQTQYLLSPIAVSPIGVWEILRQPLANIAITRSKLSVPP